MDETTAKTEVNACWYSPLSGDEVWARGPARAIVARVIGEGGRLREPVPPEVTELLADAGLLGTYGPQTDTA